MFANRSSDWMLSLKKVGYWFWLLPVALVPLSYHLAQGSAHADAWAFLLPVVIFHQVQLIVCAVLAQRYRVAAEKAETSGGAAAEPLVT